MKSEKKIQISDPAVKNGMSGTTKSSAAPGPDAFKKKPIIEISNAVKKYAVGKSSIEVLHGVNVKIYPQEFIIVLGPSGSGKSTLMNVILGLEPPTSGRSGSGQSMY